MRVAMGGVRTNRYATGMGMGFVESSGGGFSWGSLIGDLSKQWTNIAGTMLAPPAYRDANGVEIRNTQLPSLVTTGQQPGVPIGGNMVGGAAAGVQQVTGVSTQTMFGIGAALIAVLLISQSGGRR